MSMGELSPPLLARFAPFYSFAAHLGPLGLSFSLHFLLALCVRLLTFSSSLLFYIFYSLTLAHSSKESSLFPFKESSFSSHFSALTSARRQKHFIAISALSIFSSRIISFVAAQFRSKIAVAVALLGISIPFPSILTGCKRFLFT